MARLTIGVRDTGAYSTRGTGKGGLLAESSAILRALQRGATLAELRAEVLAGRILHQRARITREGIFKRLAHRLLDHGQPWIFETLLVALDQGERSPEFLSSLLLRYVLQDRLVFDFVTGPLWARWRDGQLGVDRDDLLAFFDWAREAQPQLGRWTEPTRKRLAGDILSCLRDLGLLEGTQRKRLVRPVLPLSTAEHLLRVLIAEGKRGAEILDDPTWRIFLCTPNDVADVLTRLSQTRRIGFERAGSHVVLHTPAEWVTPT
ncbi:MAG: DUF1819 family protein [Nannocystis sp.]|nr:BrxA family protein [Nannocystis sp.]MBA3547591.1 DUF1819 family protein [Nannocystis sp.]